MKQLWKRVITIMLTTLLVVSGSTTVFAYEGTQTGSIYAYQSITRMNVGYFRIQATMFGEPESSTEPAPSVKMNVGGFNSAGDCLVARNVEGTGSCSTEFYTELPSQRFAYGYAFRYLEGYDLGGMKVYAS